MPKKKDTSVNTNGKITKQWLKRKATEYKSYQNVPNTKTADCRALQDILRLKTEKIQPQDWN